MSAQTHRVTAGRARPVGLPGLALSAAAARLEALLAEQRGLLAKVAKKRIAVEGLEAEVRRFGSELHDRLQATHTRMRLADREIHALFSELLTAGRLPKRAGAELRALYHSLQLQGVISPMPVAARVRPDRDVDVDVDVDDDEAPAGANAAELPSARNPAPDRASVLKGVFRRLAQLLHPDRTWDRDDAVLRTQAMQEANRAYADNDLARLIDLERVWGAGADLGGESDSDARAQVVARANRELKDQLLALNRAWRALSQSYEGNLLRTSRKARTADPIATLEAETRAEESALRELRDQVRSFRDGRVQLGDLLRTVQGPSLEDVLSDLRAQIAVDWDVEPGARRGRGRGRGRR